MTHGQELDYMAGALLLPLEPVYELLESYRYRELAPKDRLRVVDLICREYGVERWLAFRRIREIYVIMAMHP